MFYTSAETKVVSKGSEKGFEREECNKISHGFAMGPLRVSSF